MSAKALIEAAEQMDWPQIQLNGGPPCFYFEETGNFWSGAERWEGHGHPDQHRFISLAEMLRLLTD